MTPVYFQAWRVNVGRIPVYLLDTNRPENPQHFRDLTLRVYGGDTTTRIMQEVLLGIGGVRLLRALGVQPSVFHMNEGHAALLGAELLDERLRAYVDRCTSRPAFKRALDAPDVIERVAKLGAEVAPSTPEEFGAFMRAEDKKWGDLVRKADLKIE